MPGKFIKKRSSETIPRRVCRFLEFRFFKFISKSFMNSFGKHLPEFIWQIPSVITLPEEMKTSFSMQLKALSGEFFKHCQRNSQRNWRIPKFLKKNHGELRWGIVWRIFVKILNKKIFRNCSRNYLRDCLKKFQSELFEKFLRNAKILGGIPPRNPLRTLPGILLKILSVWFSPAVFFMDSLVSFQWIPITFSQGIRAVVYWEISPAIYLIDSFGKLHGNSLNIAFWNRSENSFSFRGVSHDIVAFYDNIILP